MTTPEQTPNLFANPCIDPTIKAGDLGRPLLAAESAPRDGTISLLQSFELSTDDDMGKARFETVMGWAMTELALHPDTSPDDAKDFFAAAVLYADRACNRVGAKLTHVMPGRLLDIYIPAFIDRRERGSLEGDWQDISNRLADLTDEIIAAPMHTANPDHLLEEGHTLCMPSEMRRVKLVARMTFMMLAIEAGHAIYPASWREAQNTPQQQLAEGHDLYVMQDDTKVPFKVTVSSFGQHTSDEFGSQPHPMIVSTPL